MVLKKAKHLLHSASRKTQFLVRKLTHKLDRSDDDAIASTEERLKRTAENAGNARAQKQQWMDLILSKEFDAVLKEVFEKCAGINHDDGDDSEPSLDVAELTLAIDALYRRLETMMGGDRKLPRVKDKAETILSKYDDNNDGKLDAREWEGFARTYFSRMEWPIWKTAARGAAKGVGVFVVNQTVVGAFVGRRRRRVRPHRAGFRQGADEEPAQGADGGHEGEGVREVREGRGRGRRARRGGGARAAKKAERANQKGENRRVVRRRLRRRRRRGRRVMRRR
jgi:hypothetical protein